MCVSAQGPSKTAPKTRSKKTLAQAAQHAAWRKKSRAGAQKCQKSSTSLHSSYVRRPRKNEVPKIDLENVEIQKGLILYAIAFVTPQKVTKKLTQNRPLLTPKSRLAPNGCQVPNHCRGPPSKKVENFLKNRFSPKIDQSRKKH